MVENRLNEDQAARRRRRRATTVLGLLMVFNLLALGPVALKALKGVPVTYESFEAHFKYGSVGSDNLKAGLPYWLFRVLPRVFPDRLPDDGRPGYEAFGFVVERAPEDHRPLMDRPVGFSKRRVGIRIKRLGVDWGLDLVGLNCALCHAGTVRTSALERPQVILGMPSPTADVEQFFQFLFETAKDPKFSPDTMLGAIEKKRGEKLGALQKAGYWFLTYLVRFEIQKLEKKFCFIHAVTLADCPRELTKLPAPAGPGRIDTWGPYKVLRLQAWPALHERPWTLLGLDTLARLYDSIADLTPAWFESPDQPNGRVPGFADALAVWNLDMRLGRGFHWDGNTVLLTESGITAAAGSGATPATLDKQALDRIAVWARTAQPPKFHEYFGEATRAALVKQGQRLYDQYCASCHSPTGSRFGLQEPIERIGTDPNRLEAFTEELAEKLNRYGKGYAWRFRHFKLSRGYRNLPLDGLWLRAPYLHNGSVPTLRDLLKRPADRPKRFCRGTDLYDWENVGFISAPTAKDERRPCGDRFLYDTGVRGNGNQGHDFGTDLDEAEKEALLEYLKTL